MQYDFVRTPCCLLVAIAIALFTGACAPKKAVVLPPQWQGRTVAGTNSAKQSGQTSLLPATGEIQEQNVSAGPSQTESAETAKKRSNDPQALAAAHLVDQADANLDQGAVDQAIALYEQAIQIDVYNGDAFYGLARAWYRLGAPKRALEFARKAEILFQADLGRLKQVYLLEAEIYHHMNDENRAAEYRHKAARL